MKIFFTTIFCLQLLFSGEAFAQSFTAKVNRTDVPQGETFLLTLETDDDKNKQTPDLSVLEQDFSIYSVGNSFKSTYINGQASHSRQWQIVLMPKNAGQITIPEIKLGNLSSNAIVINVTSSDISQQADNKQAVVNNTPKFAIDAEVDNTNPYVQQQINYTLNIYDGGGLYGEAPVFIDNGNNEWIIKSLGEPTINSKIINGRQLREIQFKYALFPQKSGVLKTPDIEFQGYYLTRSRRTTDAFDDIFNSGFFNIGISDVFATRNPVVLRPKNIEINVQPVPAVNGNYWWLPASKVILSSEWDDKNPEFKVGEAVGRSIYLKASGVIETQLPDIKFTQISGVKQYPEKPVAMSSQDKGDIISIKKFTNVYIPEKSGKFTIPEISIDWFNTNTGRFEKAILPSQTINVLPSTTSYQENNLPEIEEKTDISKTENITTQNSDNSLWMVIIAFILGLTLSYLFFGRKNTRSHSAKEYVEQIKVSLKNNDLKNVRDNLILWARISYNDVGINNIDDIRKYVVNASFAKQLEQLGQSLYSKRTSSFDYAEFLKHFSAEQKQQVKRQRFCSPLPDLYKK